MDHEIRDHAAGRDQVAHDAGDDQAAPRDLQSAGPTATHLPDPGSDAEPVVVCAWCPSLHILKMARREQDVVVVYWQGKEIRIMRNGVSLKISHGICAPCRARMK